MADPAAVNPPTTVRALIGDAWCSLGGGTVILANPASGEPIGEMALGTSADAAAAVEAARAAYPDWSKMPLNRRLALMFRLRALLDANAEDLARLITREHGKTLDESRGDVRRGIEVVELACGAQAYLAGESHGEMGASIDALTWREPIGVCVGITPFNFPAMVPLWMFPVALVCGNTFVLKPSEKVPQTAVRLGELVREAGFPPGVFNLVHGAREVVEALCSHPAVAAISFVGSTVVAESVYRMGTHHGKRVQAAGGAKNALVVLPDAAPESTLRGIMGAAIDAIRIGDASRNDEVGMGPLVDAAGKERVLRGIECGLREGAELVRDGRRGIPPPGILSAPRSSTTRSPTAGSPGRSGSARCSPSSVRPTSRRPSLGSMDTITATAPSFAPGTGAPPAGSAGRSVVAWSGSMSPCRPHSRLMRFPAGIAAFLATCTCRAARDSISTPGKSWYSAGGIPAINEASAGDSVLPAGSRGKAAF